MLGIVSSEDDIQFDVELQWQERSLEYNTVNLTQAVIKTEESTTQEMNRRFMIIGSALAAGLALFALVLVFFLWLMPATPEKREWRFRFVHRFHLLYKEEATEEHDEIKETAEKGDMSGEPLDEQGRTSSGAFFTVLGVLAIAIAVSFVVVQYTTANFTIIETLQLGTSPSAAEINGFFRIVAIFRGYSGRCDSAEAVFLSNGISGNGILTATKTDAGQSCRLQWICDNCKVTAVDGVFAELKLVSRMAFAVAIPYRIEVPEFVRADGLIQTSSATTVFRGIESVKLPVDLTPMHFSDPRDGRQRYFVDISPSNTAVSEKDETAFAVCSPASPLSACPQDAVSFRVNFRMMGLFVNIERVIRSSLLDMISDLFSLAAAAFGFGGQAFVVYIMTKKFLKKVPEHTRALDLGLGSERALEMAPKRPPEDKTLFVVLPMEGAGGSQAGAAKPAEPMATHQRDPEKNVHVVLTY
eukprot:tig00000382_g24563.t1